MVFSIITIAYNSENTIERTMRSVLAQNYRDYEYIIVDGGSSDGTISLIERYEPLFNGKMKWKSEPDKGIYNAMNKGIDRAKGSVIGIVNSDDWLEPDALQIINECFENNDCDLNAVYCGWMNFHYQDGVVQVMKTDHQLLVQYAKRFEMAGVRHPAMFVGRNVYERYGTFDERLKILADTDLIVRFFLNGVRFIYPNQVVSNMSDGGISNVDVKKACKDYKLILEKNGMSGLIKGWLYEKWRMRRIIKKLLPTAMVRKYRTVNKA